MRTILRGAASIVLLCVAFSAPAAEYRAPRESQWVARDFRFHTGEVMPELRLAYARSASLRESRC